MPGVKPGGEVRRFACTACGRCCDLGPEMELGETGALADVFIMSLIFKAHSMPLDDRGARAAAWWREQGSRIPQRAAFQEKRRHLATFASRRRSERVHAREVYLTISAAVGDYRGGGCPALEGRLCGIHARRPLTCRTVPLHYSRPPSVLGAYLDGFVETPGYDCDTATGPVVLDGSTVVAPEVREARERAADVAKADRRWKEHILAAMDDPADAARCGLPGYAAVLTDTDRGFATMAPMIVAWRVAEEWGLIDAAELARLCAAQAALIAAELARPDLAEGAGQELRALLPLYEAGAAGRGRLAGAGGHPGPMLA